MDINNNNNNKQCECNKSKVVNDLLKRISNLEFDIEDKEREIERLNNIIKEVREYIENKVISNGEVIDQLRKIEVKELLKILDEEVN